MTQAESPEDHDHIVVLRNATWSDLQRHLEMRGDAPAPRIAYLEGELELTSPSRTHESQKSTIGRLVEAWCEHRGIDFSPYGSWTLEKKEVERAVEPDECYVFGDHTDPKAAVRSARTNQPARARDRRSPATTMSRE